MPPKISTEKRLSQAKRAAKIGDWATAATAYQDVLARFPNNKKAQNGLRDLAATLPKLYETANAARKTGKLAEAAQALLAITAIQPKDLDAWIALSQTQLDMGDAPAALHATTAALKVHPETSTLMALQGRALQNLGRATEAKSALTKALSDTQSDAWIWTSLGTLARANGDPSDALRCHQKARELAPDDPQSHANLAELITYSSETPHLADMQAHLAQIGPTSAAAIPLHFALFKAFLDCGVEESAFAHLKDGNALMRTATPYDFKSDAVPFALSKAIFAKGVAPLSKAKLAGLDPLSFTPVFVTGLPRSGTTLVEQMIAQSGQAQACGELSAVPLAIAEMLREITARGDTDLGPADLQKLRGKIVKGLAPYSNGAPYLIDKMPHNFRWIGFVKACLPEARIIHLQRDPMAVATSIYQRRFGGAGNTFAYDPADIARYMVLHEQTMTLWRDLPGDSFLTLKYQDIVANPEAASRALADACGLPWSEDMMHPENASSQVLSASAEQVRKPIYSGSDAAWKKHAPQFAPLQTALTQAGLI